MDYSNLSQAAIILIKKNLIFDARSIWKEKGPVKEKKGLKGKRQRTSSRENYFLTT
jgi:hypothetical protein